MQHLFAGFTPASKDRQSAPAGVVLLTPSPPILLVFLAVISTLSSGCGDNPVLVPAVTPAVTMPVSVTPASGATTPPASATLPAASAGPPAADLSARPLIWFTPLPPGRSDLPFADGSADYFDLFAPAAAWPIAAKSVGVFKLYASWIDNQATDEQLRQVVEGIQARGMAIALEIGGLAASAECGSNIEGFDASLNPIRRIQAAGGTVRLVAFDEVYAFGHVYEGANACRWPVERVAEQVAAFVQELRTAQPGILVGDIEPMWANISPADVGTWMDAYRRAAGTPFDFVHLDADWSLPDWVGRVAAAATEVRSRGIPIGFLANGGDAASDQAWIDLTRSRIDAIEARLGGKPDHVVLQSWMDHPDRALPDTDPTTFTGLVRQYAGQRSVVTIDGSPAQAAPRGVRGTVLTTQGDFVSGAVVQVSATPLDGTYQVPFVEGQVPAGATTAVIGLRVNREGVGPGPVGLTAYEIRYTEARASGNRVPDPRFARGLARWGADGTARARVVPSDRGSGRMLRIDATKRQDLGINSAEFRVTAGAQYRFSAAVRVPVGSAGSVALCVIFLKGTELARQQLDLAPLPIALGESVTDASGAFQAAGPALEPGHYRLRVEYGGDPDHWPASVETSIAVK